jgi:Dyp-type peroxidase family
VPPTLEIVDIQSPILRRRPAPYYGSYALLRIDDAAQGRELLKRMMPYVVSAADYASKDVWMSVLLTYQGLQALGVSQASLDTFPAAFRQGMAARAAEVGDSGDSAPEHWDQPYGTGQIHIALALLSVSEASWRQTLATAHDGLVDLPGIKLLLREDFAQIAGGRTSFGYKDGISFPAIEGNGPNPITSPEEPVAAGEFILGYPGEAGRAIPVPQPDVLGRNGTFAGFRKMHTRVAAFRRYLHDNATESLSAEMLAAKMLGRWPSGAPLILSPDTDTPGIGEDLQHLNNFGYADDPNGLRCPMGSHIRRMNPRDATLPVLTNVRLHRVIRHGTAYGPPLPPGVLDNDGKDRGIFFIFMSATAPDTYEFLKREWINDGNFIGLSGQMDPIAGANDGTGIFTIPARPIRRRVTGLERFTVTKGGEYGFMPSLSALRYLSDLTSG